MGSEEKCPDRILELLKDLHGKKISGELDEEISLQPQELTWRSRLNYSFIELCLQHFNEDIRLEMLGLLIDSKKTTLPFIDKELTLILTFVSINLGDRLEFVPLIKKTFKRMKESLALLKRNSTHIEKIESCRDEVRDNIQLFEQLKREYQELAVRSLNSIEHYREFFCSIRDICLSGIRPGSTHIRKKNSLRILQLQEEFLSQDVGESWRAEQAEKLFQCLLLDTYEVNKDVAYNIMTKISPTILGLDNKERVDEIVDVALRLGNSIRPIDSITAGYMLKICLLSPTIKDVLAKYLSNMDLIMAKSEDNLDDIALLLIILVIEQLKQPAKLANENIIVAASKHSLYGYLFCIKLLLSTCDLKNFGKRPNPLVWKRWIDELITICLSLNKSVSQIVNNSSPEGHFPMDLESGSLNEDLEEDLLVTPQMVLLCSWRTVKEVSLLFGFLAEKSPIGDEVGLISNGQIVEIGDHLVTLLCETKHRGAFEQAHVGFEQLCRRLWRAKEESLNLLPKLWLYQLLLAIVGVSGNSRLCATRRSAGVPFMVQALIASSPSVSKKSDGRVFHSVMRILLGLTDFTEDHELAHAKELLDREEFFKNVQTTSKTPAMHSITITEMKTHALNILRALFKHAQLGDLARSYASCGLISAIRSYDEKTWAERNAATLLYSSLITRIFGVQRTKDHVNLTLHNKMTGRVFFEKYPQLLPFMLRELQIFVESSSGSIKPSVQSILLLLSRLYLSQSSDSTDINWRIDEFVTLVSSCAKSRVYTTRELAARALVPMLTGCTVGPFVNGLFQVIINNQHGDLNLMHGYMLQVLEITKSPLLIGEAPKIKSNDFILGSDWILRHLEIDNDKPAAFPLATALVDVFHELITNNLVALDTSAFDGVLGRLSSHVSGQNRLKNRPGLEVYEVAASGVVISLLDAKLDENSLDEHTDCWKSILSHANYLVQIRGWRSVVKAVQNASEAFYGSTIRLALQSVNRVRQMDLQSVIWEFLYDVFIRSERESFRSRVDLVEISEIVLAAFETDLVQESASYFRVLGKAVGVLKKRSDGVDDVNPVFEEFRGHSWMGSAGNDCRIAVAQVIGDAYLQEREIARKWRSDENILNWWTTLLNLLVDDNSQVRKLASIALSRIRPETEVKCDSQSLKLFFEKFSKVCDNPGLCFAAYFVWSLALTEGDYEMDDSDVFNKCYNYEAYEPLGISGICEEYLNALLPHYDIHAAFPAGVQTWLSQRLNIEPSDCQDARVLITSYRHRLPPLSKKLQDILDPTYNDKLLQSLAFEIFSSCDGGLPNGNCT